MNSEIDILFEKKKLNSKNSCKKANSMKFIQCIGVDTKKIKLKLYTYIGNHLFNSAYSPIDRV